MTFGRALAAIVYVLATLSWAGVMLIGRALVCDGGCTTSDVDRMDNGVLLSFVALGIAAAALLGAAFGRRFGLVLLWCHAVVFVASVGISGVLDHVSFVFVLAAAVAGAAGLVAVGGPPLIRRDEPSDEAGA